MYHLMLVLHGFTSLTKKNQKTKFLVMTSAQEMCDKLTKEISQLGLECALDSTKRSVEEFNLLNLILERSRAEIEKGEDAREAALAFSKDMSQISKDFEPVKREIDGIVKEVDDLERVANDLERYVDDLIARLRRKS